MRNFSTLSAALALAVLSACGSGRNVEGVTTSGGTGCTTCHGGLNDTTGAPPVDVQGLTSSAAVGAHTRHLGLGVACAACHANVNLASQDFPNHRNGVVNVDFSGLAVDPTGAASPAFNASASTCSNVYCHAPSTAPGGNLAAPVWNGTITGCAACHEPPATVHGGTVATQCVVCHPTTVDASGALVPNGTHVNGLVDRFTHAAGWATPAGNGTTPHGLAATYQNKASYPTGFEGCRTCHGSTLNNPAVSAIPSCDSAAVGCHGSSAWRTTCTFCHGDANRGSNQAAPPRDVAANTASAAVGAHQTHLFGKTVSSGVVCSSCHGDASRNLPTSFEPHANGTVEVTTRQPGQNAATGAFDPATGTCSNTYCHGNLPRNPKAGNAPAWTATSGQASCDSCHAANGALCGGLAACNDVMTGLHLGHRCSRCHGNNSPAAAQVGCFACHPNYQRALGGSTTLAPTVPAVVNLGIHVDGMVEVDGTTSGLFKDFSLSLTYDRPTGNCTTNCHAIPDHVAGGAPSGPASWQ